MINNTAKINLHHFNGEIGVGRWDNYIGIHKKTRENEHEEGRKEKKPEANDQKKGHFLRQLATADKINGRHCSA